jgi:hypothetical protein
MNDSQLRDAVARLIQQLETRGWTSTDGKEITQNVAFQDVKRILSDTHDPRR